MLAGIISEDEPMRVRLYEVVDSSVGVVLRFDEFPVHFSKDEALGLTRTAESEQHLFSIDENDGQLQFEAADSEDSPLVNDAPLESGPLMPGDRLSVADREFIVSYERTSRREAPPARYRIQTQV